MEHTRDAREVRLASDAAQVFDLSSWIEELWAEADQTATGRHAGTTLIKTPRLRVVLQALGKGEALHEHTAPGPISIQVLEGELSLLTGGSDLRLKSGMLLSLPAHQPHAVEARRDSVFLLSIAPADSAPKYSPGLSKPELELPVVEPEGVAIDTEGATVVRWRSPLEGLTAAEIMTSNVVTVSADASLEAVARQFAALNISAAPVLDASGNLVGMVSESDLIDEERRRVTLPPTVVYGEKELLQEAAQSLYADGSVRTVREVMTAPAFTLSADTSARVVATEMVDRKINHVPILQDGRLVGIVARADVLRALTNSPSQ